METQSIFFLEQNAEKITCFTDGATVGMNGKLGTVKEVGLGVFIPDKNIRLSVKEQGISNNEAEFKALILAMKTCLNKGYKSVEFLLDSMIVVNRANGKRPKAKFKNERMDKFQDEVIDLISQFDFVEFNWIPREKNMIADALSKKSL